MRGTMWDLNIEAFGINKYKVLDLRAFSTAIKLILISIEKQNNKNK